jgi:hypothetical protein
MLQGHRKLLPMPADSNSLSPTLNAAMGMGALQFQKTFCF